MVEKLWDGRFSEKTNRSVEKFTASIDTDKRLYHYDIKGSIAHVRMLERCGIISDEESSSIVEGLGKIEREIERGTFTFDDSLEDIHMHIEARLLQLVGKNAQKLHTARSRNDQIALDIRMFMRDECLYIIKQLKKLQEEIVSFAQKHVETILPGYTHMQRAQPVLLGHHLMAYYEMFKRDSERFEEGLKRINVMPLGTAALAGTTFPIDREYTAELLNFPEVSANSIDSVSDRDFAIEFLSTASLCMVHFSRLSEELILWSTSEFGFIELSDAFTTGSSIMPQKKNPDVPELIRGKSGVVFGDLVALLSMMKSLPLSYNRDMQEDKKPLFEATDIVKSCIDIYIEMLPNLKINTETMRNAAEKGFLSATDLADYMVTKGTSFREAHNCAGKAVRFALDNHKELHELTLNELRSFSSNIAEDVFDVLSVQNMIDRRTSSGGTSKNNVLMAIASAERQLKNDI